MWTSEMGDTNRPRAKTTATRSLGVPVLAAMVAVLIGACATDGEPLTDVERRAVGDSLEGMLRRAYDLSGPGTGAVDRLLSLYADTGRVVSASGGQLLASRDSLAEGIRSFWETVGQNMREPRWIWERMVTDVLDRNAAVITATYRVPHRTPRGTPHELAGAMTLVFARRAGRWLVVQEHLSDRPDSESPSARMLDTTGAEH
jgi:ketosteroid isomerase-like protein